MSSIAVHSTRRLTLGPRSRVAILVLASLASAAVFVLVRRNAPLPYPAFEGACQRLRASGPLVTSRDWFSQPLHWTVLNTDTLRGTKPVGA